MSLHHARREDVVDEAGEIVYGTSNDDCLVTQWAGGSLGDDRVADGAGRHHVDQGRYEEQDGDSHCGPLARTETESADQQKTYEHAGETTHVDSRSTEAVQHYISDGEK